MEESVSTSDSTNKPEINGEKRSSLLATNPYKAKRSVSFKDKDPNLSLHTVHQVESLKSYNATEEGSFSCMRCELL